MKVCGEKIIVKMFGDRGRGWWVSLNLFSIVVILNVRYTVRCTRWCTGKRGILQYFRFEWTL